MAKIVRITTQKRNKSRYNVFVDDGKGERYAFSVAEDILVEHQLRKGLELNQATLDLLVEKDSIHRIYTQAIHFLSYRMRSQKELREYLLKKEMDEEDINQIIDRLVKEGLLNDKEFAFAFVRTRINTTSKGPLLIKKELFEKGVSAGIIDEALRVFTYEKQWEKVSKLVSKKQNNSSKKSFNQRIQTLYQNLLQKGFTQDVISDVLSEIKEDKDEDTEWEAAVFQGEKFLRKYEKKASGRELEYKLKAALFRKGFKIEQIDRFIDEVVRKEPT
ncbi:recombination regulator RecX [Aquibacillus albus]|uniref:Regulatory protein RecX n=1 Tax=Aquibacillus albus TaxID=1168171 RepID=A0ABS2N2X7_9BACI|nr:recombination regulator RecX [Aquibacillus albus]MBM7572462.1 regulatory protein [Aquibacillus albus]